MKYKMSSFKECPFCGKNDTVTGTLFQKTYVRCSCCGATGPYGKTHDEANEKWSHRTEPKPLFSDEELSYIKMACEYWLEEQCEFTDILEPVIERIAVILGHDALESKPSQESTKTILSDFPEVHTLESITKRDLADIRGQLNLLQTETARAFKELEQRTSKLESQNQYLMMSQTASDVKEDLKCDHDFEECSIHGLVPDKNEFFRCSKCGKVR